MPSVDLKFVEETVQRNGQKAEALIPILQALQEHYGYLPKEALVRLNETTEIRPAAIAGVSTFYDMFRHKPAGKHIFRVCHGTACHVAGAERVEEALRRRLGIPRGADTDAAQEFTIEHVACLGCCTLAPVVKMGNSTVGYASAEKCPEQVRNYLARHSAAAGVESTEEMGPPLNHGIAQIHVGLGSCCMARGATNFSTPYARARGNAAGKWRSNASVAWACVIARR